MASPAIRWGGVCIDCADAVRLAEFYSRLLGWEIGSRDTDETRKGGAGWVSLSNPSGEMGLSFQAEEWYEPPVWPEQPGAQTKMMHFEIGADDIEAAVALVIELGGSVAPQQPRDRASDNLRVMLDPDGHPFCLCG